MKKRIIHYIATNDVESFKSLMVPKGKLLEIAKTIEFEAIGSDGVAVVLDFLQYVLLNGSREIQEALVEHDGNLADLFDSIQFFLLKSLTSESQKDLGQAIFRSYVRFYDAEVFLENALKFFFKKTSVERSLLGFKVLSEWMKNTDDSAYVRSEFNVVFCDLIHNIKLKDEFLHPNFIKKFFEIFIDILDLVNLICFDSNINSVALANFRRQALNCIEMDNANKARILEFLTKAEIADPLYYDISVILYSFTSIRQSVIEITSRKLALCLTDDISELELDREKLSLIKKIVRFVYFEHNDFVYLINFIASKYNNFKISAYNPEIFELLREYSQEVDRSGSLNRYLKSFLDSKYPEILFRDEKPAEPKQQSDFEQISQSNLKKRKRPDVEVQTDIEKENKRKRQKTEFSSKSKFEMFKEYSHYASVEKAFETSSKINLRQFSSANIFRLKADIIRYISAYKGQDFGSNPYKFFSILNNHPSLSEIFKQLMTLNLQVFHFSEVDIKDSILSHDMLTKKEIKFEGFTNKNDKKTGNTGYVFACTSYCFDGVATSFNIHGFLNGDTKYMYKADFEKLKSMPYAVLTMQDWAMYSETSVYTARLNNDLITRVAFFRQNKPLFLREKIIQVENQFGEVKEHRIPRESEIFYGRQISLGLALSAIRILTLLGETVIQDLHKNLSTVNLSNFIATYMPLELKIPNEIPVQVCNKIEKQGKFWTDMVVTPFNR